MDKYLICIIIIILRYLLTMNNLSPQDLIDSDTLLDVIENDIVTVYFFEGIVLVEVAEGVSLSFRNGFPTLLRIINKLGTRPWVYIANRKNSYSVNPNEYKYLNKISTLRGVAIVNYNKNNEVAKLESIFCEKPHCIFNDLESAFNWARNINLKT